MLYFIQTDINYMKRFFMRIEFVEIQNFRKLRSCRVEFAKETTVFVGANNSGKTSAMDALILFLLEKSQFTTRDFTLSNWTEINKIGDTWVKNATIPDFSIGLWEKYLPSLDVWLEVEPSEIHHVCHMIPTLDWTGGLLGIRLRLEPKNIEELYKDYHSAFISAKEVTEEAKKQKEEVTENAKVTLELWPRTMHEFLEKEKRLGTHFTIQAYILDSLKCKLPVKGIAQPQGLPADSLFLGVDPFNGLIKIDKISAQRGFSDPNKSPGGSNSSNQQEHGNLSVQLRSYYSKHLDPSELPDITDIEALQSIENAQLSFDKKLQEKFGQALQELETVGYPGLTDSRITVSSKIRPMDSLNHSSAVQYEVMENGSEIQKIPLRLPEQYNGLGYQNLISMVFKLMSFRDDWMQVGKAAKRNVTVDEFFIPPLHFVLVEEPEAHLHAQVQQVFIRKAYGILRAHNNLGIGGNNRFATQLVVSTHSSHIAHEIDFASLRYFRKTIVQKAGEVPTSTVVNLSEVFGIGSNTEKFAYRYLKTTHCDLFFADAAILVEGPAERMLVPHFIRNHFKKLDESYISILEIGGSHAHRLRPLIEHLGLITLIITDLDSLNPTANNSAVQPIRGHKFVTRNSTLQEWIPGKKDIDELLNAKDSEKVKEYDDFSICVAYQCPVKVKIAKQEEEALANTFEDALVFNNIEIFKCLNGNGLIKKFKDAIDKNDKATDIGEAMFEALKNGKKAEFALELLYLQDPEKLKVPTYIHDGLSWLQKQLEKKKIDYSISSNAQRG